MDREYAQLLTDKARLVAQTQAQQKLIETLERELADAKAREKDVRLQLVLWIAARRNEEP